VTVRLGRRPLALCALAVVGLAASVTACGETGPTYTEGTSVPIAAQLREQARPALERALPETFVCTLLPSLPPGKPGRLVVVVNDPKSVQSSKDIISKLNGDQYTDYRVEPSGTSLRRMEQLVGRIRTGQPARGAAVKLGAEVLRKSCPRVEISVAKQAPTAVHMWAEAEATKHPGLVQVVQAPQPA
jgi:hypothetical protein